MLRALPAHGLRQLARLSARSQLVSLKKYLYVFRPLLACRWIERLGSQVPMQFARLVDGVLYETVVRNALDELVARKQAGDELDVRRRSQCSRISSNMSWPGWNASLTPTCGRRRGSPERVLPQLCARRLKGGNASPVCNFSAGEAIPTT